MDNDLVLSSSIPDSLPLRRTRGSATRVLVDRIGLGVALASAAAPHAFAAGGNTDPATILKAVLTILTGALGTSLAALGIIACGLAWMFGRASLGLISGVVGGIMIMFGASYIANQLVGGG